jgi:hypothetical protein
MLQLKLSKVSFSADGTQLVVQDTTGNYDVSINPTGYGTPNRAISANLILRWKLYSSTTWIALAGWTGAPYTITTNALGLTTGIPGLLPDGVETIQYLGLYSKGANVTVANGSTNVIYTGLDFTGIDYVAFSSDLTLIYKIASRGTGYLTLDTCYTGSLVSELVYDAQNADLQVLVQTYSNQCIDKEVAGTSVEEFCTGKQLEATFHKMMRLFIAQARFERTDYIGADIIMQNLVSTYFIRRPELC